MPDVWPAEFPTLTTDRLVLRETTMRDADDIFAFRSDADVQQYNLVPMRDRRESLSLIRTMRSWFDTRYAVQWGITLKGDDRVIGLCGVHEWKGQLRRAAIGYDLARAYWGQGLASEAISAVLAYAFQDLALDRLEAVTIVENARSVRLLDRFGFTMEGIKRLEAWEYDRRFDGSAIYALSRSVWAGPDVTPPTTQG